MILLIFPKFTIDDAYITFRYSENLANHYQLTWNVGEQPVEGYTGVFLPLVLALIVRIGIPAVLASKLIGIASFLAGGLLLFSFLSRLELEETVKGVATILYFSAPLMFVHALSGLETTLFCAAILACMYTLFSCLWSPTKPAWREVAFLLTALWATLIRPEGALLSLIFLAAALMAKIAYRQTRVGRFIVLSVCLYVLPTLIYQLWRLSYYGELFPLSFYAKTYTGKYILNPRTVIDFGLFICFYVLVPGLVYLILTVALRRNGSARAEGRKRELDRAFIVVWAASMVFLAILLFQYTRSILLMNFSFRFFVPFLPIFLISVAVLADHRLRAARECGVQWVVAGRRWVFALSLMGVAVQIGLNVAMLEKDILFYFVQREMVDKMCIPAAEFLKAMVPANGWLIVHVDAGAVPYYSGLKTVDFGGLNDRLLARKAGLSRQEVIDYFYSFNAAAVLFTSYKWDSLDHGDESAAIVEDSRFERYVLAQKYRSPESKFQFSPYYFAGDRVYEYYYFVYLRKDLVMSKLETSPHEQMQH